jgi:hypothetical protein
VPHVILSRASVILSEAKDLQLLGPSSEKRILRLALRHRPQRSAQNDT